MMRLSVCLLFVVFSVHTLIGCAGPQQEMQGTKIPAEQVSGKLEANGIEVVRIKPSAGGMMLDLRYRVTDLEKARKMITQSTQITLIDQASGKVLPVPNMAKVGKLRNLPNSDDSKKLYWIFFNNPSGLVKLGGKVTLVIGEVQIKDIPVE